MTRGRTTGTAVMWFRRDLRVTSNAALAAASAAGPVLPLFVIDPVLLASSGGARLRFLRESLDALNDSLGGGLVIRVGDPRAVVPAVAREVSAERVFVARDFTPYGRARDKAVSEALAVSGAALRGVGSPYAVAPGTVVKPDGSPYAVFTPFWKTWRRVLSEGGTGVTRSVESARPELVSAASDRVDWSEHAQCTAALPAAGEAAAWSRWAAFRAGAMGSYGETRDLPAVDGTSRMSTYLRWGVVHPAQLIDECDDSPGAEAYVRELCWREFYADVLFHHPDSTWANLDRRYDRMQVDTDGAARERFEVWKQGRTGFPIVDAGMRQLLATGWMHNRVRMITASFLVKDLHLPWQWGARHFMDLLVDGDLASNNHGWQWTAGSGTDAAPYHRIYNPKLQSERFDPKGEYLPQWIEEWPLVGPPMVDHGAERAEALRRRAALSVT